MSSDSDDSFIEAKKSKSTGVRARRGFSKKSASVSASGSSSLYSSRAEQCFKHIGDNVLAVNVPLSKDVECDVVLGKLKKSKSAPARCEPDLVLLSDNEDDENCSNLQNTPCGKSPDPAVILSPTPPDSPPPPPDRASSRGKRKRGGRRGKQQKQLDKAVSALTKNVTDAQKLLKKSRLFDSPDKDVCVIYDDDEITIRIELLHKIHRYQLQPDDPFSSIMMQIAAQNDVESRCVMLVHNDHTLRPTDTPNSIQFVAGDIIACHIVENTNESFSANADEEDWIELVLQRQGSRQRELLKALRHEPLSVVMKKYASTVGEDESNIQFYFDGEFVSMTTMPLDLDMENGDILDVKVVT